MDNKDILVRPDYFVVFFIFIFYILLKFLCFAPTVGKTDIEKESFLIQNPFARINVTKGVLEDTKHWAWRVQTEELPQRELNLVYKYAQGNLVTRGRTSFIMSEDRRTQNNGRQLKKVEKSFAGYFKSSKNWGQLFWLSSRQVHSTDCCWRSETVHYRY